MRCHDGQCDGPRLWATRWRIAVRLHRPRPELPTHERTRVSLHQLNGSRPRHREFSAFAQLGAHGAPMKEYDANAPSGTSGFGQSAVSTWKSSTSGAVKASQKAVDVSRSLNHLRGPHQPRTRLPRHAVAYTSGENAWSARSRTVPALSAWRSSAPTCVSSLPVTSAKLSGPCQKCTVHEAGRWRRAFRSADATPTDRRSSMIAASPLTDCDSA